MGKKVVSTITPISVQPAGVVDLGKLAEKTAFFRQHAKGDRTTQVYAGMWRAFEGWCGLVGLSAVPGDPWVVGMYLTHLAESGLRPSSIRVAYAAIRSWYRRHGGGEAVLVMMEGKAKAPDHVDGELSLIVPEEDRESRLKRGLPHNQEDFNEICAMNGLDQSWANTTWEQQIAPLIRKHQIANLENFAAIRMLDALDDHPGQDRKTWGQNMEEVATEWAKEGFNGLYKTDSAEIMAHAANIINNAMFGTRDQRAG